MKKKRTRKRGHRGEKTMSEEEIEMLVMDALSILATVPDRDARREAITMFCQSQLWEAFVLCKGTPNA